VHSVVDFIPKLHISVLVENSTSFLYPSLTRSAFCWPPAALRSYGVSSAALGSLESLVNVRRKREDRATNAATQNSPTQNLLEMRYLKIDQRPLKPGAGVRVPYALPARRLVSRMAGFSRGTAVGALWRTNHTSGYCNVPEWKPGLTPIRLPPASTTSMPATYKRKRPRKANKAKKTWENSNK
jgi:hypothetical protein